MNPAKQIRLNRLMGDDGRTLIVALDHGVAGMRPLGALANPEALLRSVLQGGADAVLVTPGIARCCSHILGKVGLIVRVDGGATALTGRWHEIRPLIGVQDALCLGADAVAAMGIVGAEGESQSLAGLARLAAECQHWGVPLLAEMLPGGLTAGRLSVEEIAVAARTGVELGADLIKIRYQGPAAAYQAVIESCYRPLVILGGSKQPAEELLGEIGQALEAGASGAAVGRNIWQHPDPAEMTRKIRAVIHPGQV